MEWHQVVARAGMGWHVGSGLVEIGSGLVAGWHWPATHLPWGRSQLSCSSGLAAAWLRDDGVGAGLLAGWQQAGSGASRRALGEVIASIVNYCHGNLNIRLLPPRLCEDLHWHSASPPAA